MPQIKFRKVKLSEANKDRLQTINSIIEDYKRQGLIMTLRQLYYQLVSRGVVPNKQAEYAKLSNLLKEGRMGGIVDWSAIEDRTRSVSSPASFDGPKDIVEAAMNQFRLPRMKGQKNYVEVWVEKDALSGVLKRVTSRYGIPIMVNRGYSSASAMFDSYERFSKAIKEGQSCYVLYLGDFDPSGIDMIRDITDRTKEFLTKDWMDKNRDRIKGADEEKIKSLSKELSGWLRAFFEVIPIALTREQIDQYEPPPNPAKTTDPRAKGFIDDHGDTSWEVDALPPDVLNDILTEAIEEKIDLDLFNTILKEEAKGKAKLKYIIKKTEW